MSKREKKNVYLLGASSLLNDMGSEMITPILPFFIQSLGGGGLATGLISGLREGISSLLKLVGGWLSDRRGSRIGIVFFGYIMSAILKLFIGVAQTSTQIISFVSLERVGKIRDAPRDAIIARIKGKNGNNFGIHEMFDKLGGVLGTIFVLILFWLWNLDFRTITLIAAGISMFSIIPLFMVKDRKTEKIKTTLFQSINKLESNLKGMVIILGLFALANFGLYMFFLLKVKEITGSATTPLLVYILFNLMIAIFAKRIGKYSDALGKRKIIIIGYILFSLICICFSFVNSLIFITILFSLYGVVIAMTEPVQRSLIADLSGKEKGTAMGLYYFSIGIATVIGGIIAGYIGD
jgi:MFS family permease